MLVALLVFSVLTTIFSMAAVGHLSNIENLTKAMADSRLAELKMFNGSQE